MPVHCAGPSCECEMSGAVLHGEKPQAKEAGDTPYMTFVRDKRSGVATTYLCSVECMREFLAKRQHDGSPDEGESVEIDAEAAAVAFDALQLLLEFDAHEPPLHPLADIGREPVEEASRTLGEVLAAPGGEDA